MALAYFWVAAIPLFTAAALVAGVSLYFIPAIKTALLAYAACRGSRGKCPSLSIGVNALGQAAIILSLISFVLAGSLEIAALAFIVSWFLGWLGLLMQVSVLHFVEAGVASCVVAIIILIGVLTNAYSYKSCMDQQDPGPISPGPIAP
jgi:hypothetical protein